MFQVLANGSAPVNSQKPKAKSQPSKVIAEYLTSEKFGIPCGLFDSSQNFQFSARY
jgi:hypothetical protein